MQTSQGSPLRTMVARISADDIVIYANAALASYLKVKKRDLIGSPLDVVSRRCKGEISSCFSRPDTGRSSNHLVTDETGRVFEAKVYSDGGVLDIVLDEVTSADSIGRELRDASGTPFESLSEDELRTTRHPERRYLTVSFTRLLGVAGLTERLAPMEVRLMVNSFVEEASDAIFEIGCTVGETSGESIMGIFGAPRYYTDHPLRAILASCDQMRKAAQLHAGFHREGKELPPNSIGIWTGDVLVGTLGNSAWQHYTALGLSVELAQKLTELARPGEILLPEHTLTHLLRVLPAEWEHVRAESEYEPDLSDFQWSGDDIAPVAEHLRKVVYLVGRGVQEHADQVELYFNYLWALKIPGRDQYVPILSVTRPMEIGDSLELSEDNVVTTQVAQTLGKYKLITVIGSGGMGKVWRGVDRFGNVVAIKVLHSGENVTDATLKRFRREAEIMARLPHRNICRVFEMNEFDGIQYLAMEFVDGLTLSDLLYEKADSDTAGAPAKVDLKSLIHSIRSGRSSRESAMAQADSIEAESASRPKLSRILPVEQTLSILLKVCEAVQFAHEHGVLHRDLKPGNILLREDGEPLVADFGLAKLSSADATQSLSMTGHVVGTLENMSPEQAESSKTVDERADVYALGTILYQMLTGRRHFEATGNIVVDAQALRIHEPVRPRALNSHIDLDLEIITLKALRNDPVERYRSVSALLADIERYRRGEVISARPVTPAELIRKLVQRNRAVTAVIAASLAILVIGTVVTIIFLNGEVNKANQAKAAALVAKGDAEAAKSVAQSKEAEANKQTELATARQKEADEATLKVKEQNEALQKALAERDSAQNQVAVLGKKSESDSEKVARAERETEEKQKQVEEAQKEVQRLEEAKNLAVGEFPRRRQPGMMPARPQGDTGPSEEAQEDFDNAREKFQLGVAVPGGAGGPPGPGGPLGFGGPPGSGGSGGSAASADAAVETLNQAMDLVSRALALYPKFVPAWALKARLHLCLMEYDQAAYCFSQAAALIGTGAAPMPNENPQKMAETLMRDSKMLGDRTVKILEDLRASGQGPDARTVDILSLVSSKARKASLLVTQTNPLGRPISPGETIFSLIEKNGPGTQVDIKTVAGGGKPVVVIWNSEKAAELKDLSPLKQLDPGGIAILGASLIDWLSLKNLPSLVSLDVSKCTFGHSLPAGFPQIFPRLLSLNLSETDLGSIEFLRGLNLLQTLNLSGTNVTDLSPLLQCPAVRDLNLGGLNPANLRVLFRLPMTSLVVSPLLVTDKSGLNSLRGLQSLKMIRAPGDREGQSYIEFWRKIDASEYDQSN